MSIEKILADKSGRLLTAAEKRELEAGLKAYSAEQSQQSEPPRYAGRELDDVEACLRFKHLSKAPAGTWTKDDREFVAAELRRRSRAGELASW